MARAATTTDAFNAIAERHRRDIIEVLAAGRQFAVGELVLKLGMSQPTVSKHLGVLRKVGIVVVLKRGQQRLYSLEAKELKPVHDWVSNFERFWRAHVDGIAAAAERKAREIEKVQKKSNQKEHKP
jgi:DNA-binding transcriptional ArsR family regulator